MSTSIEINKEMYVYNKNFTPSQKRFVVAKVNGEYLAKNPDIAGGFTAWKNAEEITNYLTVPEVIDLVSKKGAMVRFQGPTKKTEWRAFWAFKFDEPIEKYEYKVLGGKAKHFKRA